MNTGDRIVKAIKEAGKVVVALSDLALKIGTLLGIIKMLWDSFR